MTTIAFKPRLVLATGLTLVSLAACGDDDPASPGNPQDITISVSPGALTLLQGEGGSVSVSLESTGGFDESVTLLATGAPSGVEVDGAVIDGGSGTATLGVSTTPQAETGVATVTVTATGIGVAAATATFDVTINRSGGFTLAAVPNPVNMTRGTTETATVGIARIEPFVGPVSLTIGNAPAGLSATLDSASVGGDLATVTLVADSSLTGSYTVFVEGTGSNVENEAIAIFVNIFP